MNKQTLYTQMLNKYNQHLYKFTSFTTFLQGCYEIASERKQYVKCSLIIDIINDENNSY